MEYVVKVGDIVLLEDDLNYRVMKCIELDGQGYLVIKKFDLTIGSVLQTDEQKQIVVQEVIDENDDYYLKIVTDESILEKIENLVENDDND